MGQKIDPDATPSVKLLRIFRKLLLNGRRHYQNELAEEFQCSAQTIIRIMADIESVIGVRLESGIEQRRKWYRIKTKNSPESDIEELRYLSVCRDLAEGSVSRDVLARIDDTIASLDNHLANRSAPDSRKTPAMHFLSKGRIDYTSHVSDIEKLIEAIERKQVCNIRYREGGRVQFLRFAPACLLNLEEALFAAGAALEKKPRLTNLAIHRILDITLADEKFCLSFPDYSEDLFGLPWHEPRTFHIHFNRGSTAEFIAERVWSDAQIITQQADGSLLLEITTRSEDELRAWVRSFGSEATMLD